MFDPNSFLDQEVTGANDTERVKVPLGERQAILTKLLPKVVGANDLPLLEVFWQMDCPLEPEYHEQSVKQTVWLDITPAGGLDTGKGKNVDLGKIREAVDQNDGTAWNPGTLIGARATVNVAEEGEYRKVNGVTAAA